MLGRYGARVIYHARPEGRARLKSLSNHRDPEPVSLTPAPGGLPTGRTQMSPPTNSLHASTRVPHEPAHVPPRDAQRPESHHAPFDVGGGVDPANHPKGRLLASPHSLCLDVKKPDGSTPLASCRSPQVLPPTTVDERTESGDDSSHDPGLTPWVSAAEHTRKRSTSLGPYRSPCNCP